MSVSPFRDLESLLDEVASMGTVSVWWGDLVGVRFSRDADESHYGASEMKLPLVLAALRRAERGEIKLNAQVRVHNSFASVLDGSIFSVDPDEDDDPGTWAALESGTTRSLFQLADHAITHSGNLAGNLVLEAVGLDEIAHVLDVTGCSPKTSIRRGREDVAAREAGITNTVTAADLARIMASVARRDTALGGAPVCAPVEAMLARQQRRTMIPAGLPSSVPVANQTGWQPGVAHDVALVRPIGRAPYVLAVCTTTNLNETAAAALIASISKAVWKICAA
ncbi:MAG: class A beta-lactamase-related serine hydrolase [Micrococcales bacterium]|nr:class A beta-lactamase-related serine hydrolase [Micrococcales bacterium]